MSGPRTETLRAVQSDVARVPSARDAGAVFTLGQQPSHLQRGQARKVVDPLVALRAVTHVLAPLHGGPCHAAGLLHVQRMQPEKQLGRASLGQLQCLELGPHAVGLRLQGGAVGQGGLHVGQRQPQSFLLSLERQHVVTSSHERSRPTWAPDVFPGVYARVGPRTT